MDRRLLVVIIGLPIIGGTVGLSLLILQLGAPDWVGLLPTSLLPPIFNSLPKWLGET
jgi:hypothetical protein